jgi:RNAse (barnase) inhibitor barstar
VHASVPANITSKKTLFATVADQLFFPDYFGGNWDAFDECLRDLSWLPLGEVALNHADVPLVNDVPDAMIYLAILDDAVRKISKSGDRALLVVFPAELQGQIDWLLRSKRVQDAR